MDRRQDQIILVEAGVAGVGATNIADRATQSRRFRFEQAEGVRTRYH
jgi:hypothetical protein